MRNLYLPIVAALALSSCAMDDREDAQEFVILLWALIGAFFFWVNSAGKAKAERDAARSKLELEAVAVRSRMASALREKYGTCLDLSAPGKALDAYEGELRAAVDDGTFREIDWHVRQAEFLDSFWINGDPQAHATLVWKDQR